METNKSQQKASNETTTVPVDCSENDIPKSLKFELEVNLEEFKSLRDEIISLQEFSRQNITTTYAGIGVLSAFTPFIIQNNLQFIFLIFPFFFYSVGLTAAKYALAGLNIGSYIREVIIPNTRRVLEAMGCQAGYSEIFSWEEHKGVVRKYGILFLPATGAHYWIVLFTALLSVVAYFYFPPNPKPYPIIEYLAIAINAMAFIYTASVGLYAGFSR